MNAITVPLYTRDQCVIIVMILKTIRSYKQMSYHTVTTYTTKLKSEMKSDNICCAERRMIKNLKHDFFWALESIPRVPGGPKIDKIIIFGNF